MEEIKYNDIYSPITPDALERIPEEMRAAKRWICWGSDKVPVSVTPAEYGKNKGKHYGIDVKDPENFGTFEQAAAAIGKPAYVKRIDENFHINGVGFVVGDSWFCADLDGGAGHGKEDVPRNVVDFALANTMPTYAEKSVSGCGYHFFGKCNFDTKQADGKRAESNQPHRDKNGNPLPESYEVEFFTRRKFIAVTGNIITGQPAANTHAVNCNAGAYQFYTDYILNDWRHDEEKRAAERARIRRTEPVNASDAEKMFLMNYPEILAAASVDNFKRGGPGVKLPDGQYSWIAALKAMHEIGVPDYDIIEWCRPGNSFKSEKDVLNVIYKKENTGTASVAGLIKCAQENGWKPDPEKLTGEAKQNHERKVFQEEQERKYREAHREEHAAQLAALGIDCAGDPYRFEWTLNFDGSIQKVIEKETGEIVYEKVSGFDVLQANAAAVLPADPDAPWEPIIKGNALPRFPLEQFPAWIQEHINSFVAVTGVNADYCAASVLGAISAVTVGHCAIQFNGTHREPIQLYSIFVGSSGTMKSSVIRHFMEPANDYLRKNNRKVLDANYAIEKEIENLNKEISAEKRAGKKADLEKIKELSARIDQKRQERHASYPVPWDDVTPESLLNAMNFSRGTANIATAEGNIINVICGRSYTQRGAVQNIDVFLKGADGESIHNFRITNNREIDIPRADLSMLLAIQPGLLERLCTSADAISRGLAQRFLIYAPEETENTIDHTLPVFMDPAHSERWAAHIQYIAARFMDPDGDCKQMPLEPAADRIIRDFWNYEKQLKAERGPGDDESITSWIGKLHGKALRVAALLALLRDKTAQTITKQDAEISIYLFKQYYIPHFIGAFEHADNLTREQRLIVNWITRNAQRTGRKEQFTQRDLWMDIRQRSAFAGNIGRERFATALAELQDKNYIRPAAPVKTPSGRGRPGNAWQINPELYTK